MTKLGFGFRVVFLVSTLIGLSGCSSLQSTVTGTQNEAKSSQLGSESYPFTAVSHALYSQFPLASAPSTYNQETIYWVQINSQEGLSALNKEAFSTVEYLALLNTDFSTYSIILVTQTKGTPGYDLEVTSVQSETIICKEARPSEDAALPSVMTYPTHVILINKSLAIKQVYIN